MAVQKRNTVLNCSEVVLHRLTKAISCFLCWRQTGISMQQPTASASCHSKEKGALLSWCHWHHSVQQGLSSCGSAHSILKRRWSGRLSKREAPGSLPSVSARSSSEQPVARRSTCFSCYPVRPCGISPWPDVAFIVSHGPCTSKAFKTNDNNKQKLKWHLLPIQSCILIQKRLLLFSTKTCRKAANAFFFLSFSCLYLFTWQPVYLYKLLQFVFLLDFFFFWYVMISIFYEITCQHSSN